jgi:2-dehydropantoate 2-reductase
MTREPRLRICIFGAGAVGGLLAAALRDSDADLTLVDRGAQLAALRERGLTILGTDASRRTIGGFRLAASGAEAGPQDVVILAVKAHQIEPAAPDIGSMLDKDAIVVTTQNGIPWWYFHRHGGSLEGTRLASLDPEGMIDRHIPAERVVGCVAYCASRVVEPGVVHHVEGHRFPVGELDGAPRDRVRELSELLASGGLKSRILPDIRSEIWLKAVGSAAFNPISALTGGTLEEICRSEPSRTRARQIMEEASAVRQSLGVELRRTIDERLEGAARVGPHKTSMLQDVEAGEPTEHAALIGSIIEIGRLRSVPTPRLDAVYSDLLRMVASHG